MKKISVIIPAYNCDCFIEATIKSIQDQNYENLEILIINDGSTDNTLSICEKLAVNDRRIRIINQINGGVSKARNTGLVVATGDYIHFVDSDDKVINDLYNKLNIYLEEDYDVIRFDYTKNKQPKKELNEIKTIKYNHNNIENDIIMKVLTFEMTAYVWQIIYKNNKKIKFNEKLKTIEDNAFCIELFLNCNNLITTNEAFYEYNVTNLNSATKDIRKTKMMMENLLIANKEIKEELKRLLPNKDEYLKLLDSYNFHYYSNYYEILLKGNVSKKEIINIYKELDNEYNIRDIFNNFDYKKLSLKHRITTILTMYRKYNLLWLLYKCKQLF